MRNLHLHIRTEYDGESKENFLPIRKNSVKNGRLSEPLMLYLKMPWGEGSTCEYKA